MVAGVAAAAVAVVEVAATWSLFLNVSSSTAAWITLSMKLNSFVVNAWARVIGIAVVRVRYGFGPSG